MRKEEIKRAVEDKKMSKEDIDFMSLCVEFVNNKKFPNFTTLIHIWSEYGNVCADINISDIGLALAERLNAGEISEEDILDMSYSQMLELCY